MPGVDLSSITGRFGDMGAAVMEMINAEVTRQALMVAYVDNFYAMGWLILLIAPVALFLKDIPLTGKQSVPLSE